MSTASRGVSPRASQSGPPSSGTAASRKDALRKAVQAARATRVAGGRVAGGRVDGDRLPRLLAACAGHGAVACYFSVPPEPDTVALVTALRDAGVRVLLPVLKGHREPAWNWYAGADSLVPGWRGIPEPAGTPLGPDELAACSFVWVSALQVTPAGFRLGTGGGWYDRALLHAAPDAVRATLVDDTEVVDAVPLEPWDLPVDLVVTPTRVLATGARGVRLPSGEQPPRA